MKDRAALCAELTATWHREIPIVAAMGAAVESYDGRSLAVRAPMQPNRNVHGTTFAGSLYSTCVLTGWGAVWLALRERGLDAVIYAAESAVQYRKAVAGDFVCRCTFDAAALEAELEQFKESGRASFDLACTIDHGGKRAVAFTGKYVIHAKRS
ncbi:MAG TPA: YiiD C-terminal domain-containing protein [Gammaproteobacteria bacterium]|nr:YiiD C-terminal domain-containing protein [Gammaproteobacteria bacterium]